MEDQEHVLKLLETFRQALKDLQNNSIFTSNTSSSYALLKSILNLETKPDSVLFKIPRLFKLSQLLCNLRTLIEKLETVQGHGWKSLIRWHITRYKISQVAKSVEAEIQAYIDRANIECLMKTLELEESEEKKVEVLSEFTKRVSKGFDVGFQDLVLKAKVFSILESLLCDSNCSKRVREHVAFAIDALCSFNRNVFVGLMLMGTIIQALISMDSSSSIRVLSSLINLVRSPLIDEIHSRGEIPKLIKLLSSEDLSIRVATLDCVCEIAYFGRWEVIEAMLQEGLISKLMELQRSKHGGNLIKTNQCIDEVISDCDDDAANSQFANCVARFAVLVEVGEGLSSKEKEEVKLEILKRVREASVSEAESATIVSEQIYMYLLGIAKTVEMKREAAVKAMMA